MRFGSLFSGIGGWDLGLERAGMSVAWQCDIDPWCRRVLAKHWPDTPRFADIREITAESAEPVEVICGGFPCQPVSLAGKRKAQEDERWLWPEFARVVGEIRPRYILVENVPGLLSRGMGDVLGDLAAMGFDCEWGCIRASDAGAPHKRERVWIVAHASGEGLEGRPLSVSNGPQVSGAGDHRAHVPDTPSIGRQRPRPTRQRWLGFEDGYCRIDTGEQWKAEPGVCRVADGIPLRVDRLRGLGNALVPQIAEHIGKRIMGHESV